MRRAVAWAKAHGEDAAKREQQIAGSLRIGALELCVASGLKNVEFLTLPAWSYVLG